MRRSDLFGRPLLPGPSESREAGHRNEKTESHGLTSRLSQEDRSYDHETPTSVSSRTLLIAVRPNSLESRLSRAQAAVRRDHDRVLRGVDDDLCQRQRRQRRRSRQDPGTTQTEYRLTCRPAATNHDHRSINCPAARALKRSWMLQQNRAIPPPKISQRRCPTARSQPKLRLRSITAASPSSTLRSIPPAWEFRPRGPR